jgi:hypothetical protein
MAITPEELRIALDRPVFGSAFVKAVAGGIALLDAIRRKTDHPSWSAKLHLRFQGIRARRAANAALRAYGTGIGRSLDTSEQATLRKLIADKAFREMERRMYKEAGVEEADLDTFPHRITMDEHAARLKSDPFYRALVEATTSGGRPAKGCK